MIYGLSPYGGLVRYWDRLLAGLTSRGMAIDLIVPASAKAPFPKLEPRISAEPNRWIFHSSYLSVAPARACATVMTVHDLIFEDHPQLVRALDPNPGALQLKQRCIALADRIIVPSMCTLHALRDHHPAAYERAHVIHQGVDNLFFEAIKPAARDTAHTLRVAHGSRRPFLLHVGGREHHKNFTVLLQAYIQTQLHEQFDLLVVGSQPEALPTERRMLERAPRSAVVAFTGQVDLEVLAALYREATVVVAPALQEGFGLAPLEAMASGAPVACAANEAFAETLGDKAFAFDP